MKSMEAIPKARLRSEEKQVFSTQPKQLFARLKQNEQFSFNREQQGRSSKEERKVNALALRADEGRDNLR